MRPLAFKPMGYRPTHNRRLLAVRRQNIGPSQGLDEFAKDLDRRRHGALGRRHRRRCCGGTRGRGLHGGGACHRNLSGSKKGKPVTVLTQAANEVPNLLTVTEKRRPKAPHLHCGNDYARFTRRRAANAPARPTPNSESVIGSGTLCRKPRISPPRTTVEWMFR